MCASSPSSSGPVVAMLPYTLLTLAVTLAAVVWKSASLQMLVGLTYYLLPETPEEKRRAALARIQEKKRASSGAGGGVRRRGRAAGGPGGLGPLPEGVDDESIAAITVQKSTLVLRPFWAEFNYLILFSLIVVANFAAAEVAARVPFMSDVLLMKENVMLPMLCLVAIMSAARALVKVEMDSLTPAVERQLAAAVGVLGFIVSLFFLLLVPTSVMDFEMERTSREFAPALIRAIRRRVKGFEAAEDLSRAGGTLVVSELQIMIGLSIFAGVLAGAMFAPSVRVVRCYSTCVKPPAWGRDFVGVSTWAKPFLHAATALPLLAAVSWAKPLVQEPLGLTDEAFVLARVGALLVVAATQLAATPSLVQGFLDGALVVWYELKNGGQTLVGSPSAGGPTSEKKGFVAGASVMTEARVRAAMRQKMEITNHIVCKVAVQAAAPAVLLLSCGCLLGCKRTDDAAASGASDSIVGILPAVVWRTVASYLGWWSCTAWAIMTNLGVAMAKGGASTFA